MKEFMINGIDIPTPVKWQVQEQAVTTAYSGKQTLDGRMHNSVIRSRKTITAQWGMLKGSDIALLRQIFAGNNVLVHYPEANDLGFDEAHFIPGQQSRPIRIVTNGETYWKSFQIKLTEV